MVKLRLAALLSACFLSGCDSGYSPSLQNGFGTSVTVTVTFDDGSTSSTVWPPCTTSFVGKEVTKVVRVQIEKDGKLLRTITAEQALELATAEDSMTGYRVWNVGPHGIKLVTDSDSSCEL